MDKCIVIDNLPSTDKTEKITKLIKELLAKIGTVKKVQYDKAGFMFCQFETIYQANNAVRKVDKYQLDKTHTLRVNHVSDIQLALSDPVMPDEGEVNQVDDSTLKDGESINNWLQDSRDQYFITKSDTTEVNWFKQELIQARTKWSESYMKWSPLGSYICSVHAQGIVLSGDSDFKRIHHFTHPGVKLFDISPNELYITTWSPHPHPQSGHNLFLWNIKSESMLKSFNVDTSVIAQSLTMNIGSLA